MISLDGIALCYGDTQYEINSMLFPFNLLPQFGSGHNAGIRAGHLVMFIHFTINPSGNTADLVAPWCVVPGWMLALGYDIILCSMIITLGSSQASLADSSIDQGLCIRKVCTVPDASTRRVVFFCFSQKYLCRHDCRRSMPLILPTCASLLHLFHPELSAV